MLKNDVEELFFVQGAQFSVYVNAAYRIFYSRTFECKL